MDKSKGLIVSSAPHLKGDDSVDKAMKDVMIALIPVTAAAVFFFGVYALFLVTVCMVTAALTEVLFRTLMKKRVTLYDYSALLTGLLVALCFSATTAWWNGALATFIAVGFAKELMGGLGWNRFNPALFGRVALIILAPVFALFSADLSTWSVNLGPVDVMTQATPLAMLQRGMEMPGLGNLFVGFPGGAMSEASALLVLLGGLYLLYKKHITWLIPVSIIGTVFVLTAIAGIASGKDLAYPFYHMFSGGLMLGAFFMATDWVTSPITDKGKIVFGVLIGILIVVFRVGLAPTEGVAFSILIMNGFVPMIERATKHKSFSEPRPVRLPMEQEKAPVSQ